MNQIDLFRLFWEAGLAVGLFTMSYLKKRERREKKHEIRSNS